MRYRTIGQLFTLIGLAYTLLLVADCPAQLTRTSNPPISKSIETFAAEQNAFKSAAEFAAGSVVRIETFGGMEKIGAEQISSSTATGTVIAPDGWIISSLFAFRNNPASITVLMADGKRKNAKIIARDNSRELILLKIDVDQPLPVLEPVQRTEMVVGQWCLALGRTFSADQISRSTGILSAINRIWDKAIQSDAKISPANYGGPLIDLEGRCLGILAPVNPGIATEGEVQQWYDSGIGFAVPLEDILERLERLKSGQDIYSGKLGVQLASLGDFSGPVRLAGVTPGSPAAKSGFQKDDILISVAGRPIGSPNEMRHALGPLDDLDAVEIVVEREGQRKTITSELVAEIPVYREPWIGILLSQNQSSRLKIDAVMPDSPAEESKLAPGDEIVSLNGKKVEDIAGFSEALAFLNFRAPIELQINRQKSSDGNANDEESSDENNSPTPSQKIAESIETMTVSVSMTSREGKVFPNVPRRITIDTISNASDKAQDTNVKSDDSSDKQPSEAVEKNDSDSKDEKQPNGIKTGPEKITLSDLPNRGFRFIPNDFTNDGSFGVLMILPEAGKFDQKNWIDEWEDFCSQRKFVLLVLGSASEQRWAFEEVQTIRRVLTTLQSQIKIDSRKICIGGAGSGGTMAFIAAFEKRKEVLGTFVIESRVPGLVRTPTNEPLDSLRIMLLGQQDAYSEVRDKFDDAGFSIGHINEPADANKPLESSGLGKLKNWIASLEWF